ANRTQKCCWFAFNKDFEYGTMFNTQNTPSIIIREQKNLQSNSQHEGASIDSTLSRISNSEASAKAHKSEQISIDQKVTRNQMVEQGLIQELTEFIIEESIEIKKSFYLNDKKTVTVQSLVHLYQKASLAEKNTIQAKQEEILCWYYYGKDFEKMVSEILSNPFRIGARKRQSDANIVDFSSKKPCIISDISYFCPDEDVPLQVNGTMDVLEVVKSTVSTFDPKTITLGSFRSYKSSNHLLVDSKQNGKVPRESMYDAEMYRILTNWLAKVHGYEVTGQWHLKGICEDGGYHHFYCDLTIKKSDDPSPVAVLELLATSSLSKLDEHFERVFDYSDQFKPSEVWVIHFSREDDVVKDPYWPCIRLQERRLNVIHFWYNKNFTNVRMSTRSLDTSGRFCEIIDQQILP
ncbi:5617_t:CDS:2, partial [Diversispora eburnea]